MDRTAVMDRTLTDGTLTDGTLTDGTLVVAEEVCR